MAHEIDMSNGRANVAFIGEVPWHGLGQQLTEDSTIDEWQTQAGMDWDIRQSPAMGIDEDTVFAFPERSILYRSDTRAPLSIVSDQYQVVQPKEVLEFYRDLTETAGFKLNTAGVLFGGRKFWALAELGESATLMGRDKIDGYLLLATSCDGSLATAAQFTSVRVVCNNTLTMATRSYDGKRNSIKIPHSRVFNHDDVKAELGVAGDSFDFFIENANTLSLAPASDNAAIEFVNRTLNMLPLNAEMDDEHLKASDSKAGLIILDLYAGGGRGSLLPSALGTYWGLVNAVTEYQDHHRNTKTSDSRLNRTWFGDGAAMKDHAFKLAMDMAA